MRQFEKRIELNNDAYALYKLGCGYKSSFGGNRIMKEHFNCGKEQSSLDVLLPTIPLLMHIRMVKG